MSCSKMDIASPSGEGLAFVFGQKTSAYHFSDRVFEEDLDLIGMASRAKSGPNRYLCQVRPILTFENCVFKGDILAYSEANGEQVSFVFEHPVSFINCDFKGEFNLKAADFRGGITITDCRFNEAVTMEDASFGRRTVIRESHFFKSLRMQNAHFHENANFFGSTFHDNASFQQAYFSGEAQFSKTDFRKYADLSLALFNKGFFANYAEFSDRLNMDNADFRTRCEFLSVRAARVSIRNAHFRHIVVQGSEVSERFDLSGSHFSDGEPDLSGMKVGELLQ